MELNLTKEKVNQYDYVFSHNKMSVEWSEARDIGHEIMGESLEPKDAIADLQKYQEDWLTLESECTKRGELIEQLNHALRNESENTTTRKLTITKSALSAVEEWRREQG